MLNFQSKVKQRKQKFYFGYICTSPVPQDLKTPVKQGLLLSVSENREVKSHLNNYSKDLIETTQTRKISVQNELS
jgi:hypothetical protein